MTSRHTNVMNLYICYVYMPWILCAVMYVWIIGNIAGSVETRISRSAARNIIGIATQSRSLALRYVDAWYRADRFDGIFDLIIARE